MEDKELSRIFLNVGTRHGFEEVTASFVAFRDFKVKWSRNYKWASFEVSDYLDDADAHIIESLAETIFGKIKGNDTPYSDDVRLWLTRKEFVKNKQPVYVRRFKGLTDTPCGMEKDLEQSYRRLIDSNLLEEDPELFIGWIQSPHSRCVGRSSTLMKVVGMSKLLDTDMIADDVLDYCLYSQVARISLGFNPGDIKHHEEYDRLLSKFPDRTGKEASLKKMCLHL